MTPIKLTEILNFQWVSRGISQNHSKVIKQAIVVALMGLHLWLIYIAASWGLADLFAKQARYDMQQWEDQALTTDSWKSIHATLTWAQSFEPDHPDLLESTGHAYYLLYRSGVMTAAEQLMALQQALDYYLKAAKQRPVSAYTWANIAILKSRLGQYDAQFLAALESAAVLGPWEPFVQRAVADVGLAAWYKFPKEGRKKGRKIVFAAIERGMHKQAHLMSTLIKRHRRELMVCAYRGGHTTRLADFCQ